MGLPPHTPLGDFIPKPHLRYAAVLSGLAESGFALRPDSCFFESLRDLGERGVTMGLPPHALLGDFIPKPHLRFAAALTCFTSAIAKR